MHYYRRDGVRNGAGHQSRAPFEEMMHWGKMQTHIRLRSVSHKWSPHFDNILPSVDKMQCNTHKYGWNEKWIGQKRGDTSATEKDLSSWESVMVVLVGASVLGLHYDVCAHKSLCHDCFCGSSNMRMSCLSLSLCTEHCSYWLRELILARELVFWVFDVPYRTSYSCWGWHQCLVKCTAMSPGWARHIVLL